MPRALPIWITAGPSRTAKIAGNIQKINGKSNLTGSLAAFSRVRRFLDTRMLSA